MREIKGVSMKRVSNLIMFREFVYWQHAVRKLMKGSFEKLVLLAKYLYLTMFLLITMYYKKLITSYIC